MKEITEELNQSCFFNLPPTIKEKNNSIEVPQDVYYVIEVTIPEQIPILEISDNELREVASRGKTYEFWDQPEEDIYSLSDGKPL